MKARAGTNTYMIRGWTVTITPDTDEEYRLIHRLGFEAAGRLPDKSTVIMPHDERGITLVFKKAGSTRDIGRRFRAAVQELQEQFRQSKVK